MLDYAGKFHAAHKLLATNLVLRWGDVWRAKIKFPRKVKRTWACWLFLEDTYAIFWHSRLRLYVNDNFLTIFNVAAGRPGYVIQSLAEHLTDKVLDATKEYEIRLENAGFWTIVIEELFIRWFASEF